MMQSDVSLDDESEWSSYVFLLTKGQYVGTIFIYSLELDIESLINKIYGEVKINILSPK